MTFRDLASDWLNEQHHFAPLTRKRIHECLDLHLLPTLGDLDITALDHGILWRTLRPLKQRGQLTTLRQCRSWLTIIIHHGMSMQLIDHDPTSALRDTLEPKKRQPTPPHRFVSQTQLPDLLRDIQSLDDRLSHLTLKALLSTTLRIGCLVQARWEHLDLDTNTWYVPASTTKNARDHTIPVTPRLRDILERLPHREGRLFPVHVDTVRGALKRSGWHDRQTLHGFRHIAKTVLEEHAWPSRWAETQLHHIEGGISGIYNAATYLNARRVMMTWYEDYLGAIAQGPLTAQQQRAFAERVKAAITASPAEHILWTSSKNTPKTDHDQDEIRQNRKRTLAPWRNK